MFKIPSVSNHEIVIFIPAYNCEKTIVQVIEAIPTELRNKCLILIIDNGSSDETVELIKKFIENEKENISIYLIATKINLGYSGSQKLAYQISSNIQNIKWVVMLHGDGQYDPLLITKFLPYCDSNLNAVYGYRSKLIYGSKEETPLITWASIKFLNVIESFVTGVRLKEWHTGFVMYSTNFLEQLDFSKLTETPHLDGQLLAISSKFKNGNESFVIYKRYKGLQAFEGAARFKYIKNVFKLMPEIRKIVNNPDTILIDKNSDINYLDKFSIVCSKEIE
jgi:glycosyltransferase involved in cell wall biosynthesis